MHIRRIAILAALLVLPLSAPKAQYSPPCSPFPLALPFCVAGAVVGTAANIATAPIWLAAGAPPPFRYGPYPPPGYYYPPPYYPPPPPYYYGPR